MINIIPTQATSFRAFGWVQDPSNFRSLCDVVAAFDTYSSKHGELIQKIIPDLIEDKDGKAGLIAALQANPLEIKYVDLVGTSFMPRSSARCNGIVQAVVPGQRRPFIGDWPANNFVRWAHALGFIKYNYENDAFSITESGLALSNARTDGNDLNLEEKKILTEGILAYPPAVRILKLLSKENAHLTKFEIGKQLGFVGEAGFTSLPQSILIRTLDTAPSAAERNKMKTDWDGSSDKYARMISNWLVNLGLLIQHPKEVSTKVGNVEFRAEIGQAYLISAEGIKALNRIEGKSSHKRIAKNICFEMMSTKPGGGDREYIRTRRCFILKIISERNDTISMYEILDDLKQRGLEENIDTIKDDISGLINIGLNIIVDDDECTWMDCINDFTIPLSQNLTRSDLATVKDELRPQLTHLSHEYLSLLDLAYDSKQNRLFEMKTMELLTEECGFEGTHLGGGRKPDGICYTVGTGCDYGIIVDTKAYSKGYNLPISQADEMERYVRENQTRDSNVNPNVWWENFPDSIRVFYYMFVAGHFGGKYQDQIERVSMNTGVKGTALNVTDLLLLVNRYKAGLETHDTLKEYL